MQGRRGNASAHAVVHNSQRRPTEVAAIDMNEIWADQQVEAPQWIAIYGSIVQGATMAQMMVPEGSDPAPIDYEALATEADEAYARYAARLRGQR